MATRTSLYCALALAVVLIPSGCRSPYHADQGAFTGGLVGTGIGAIIGNQSGRAAEGALVGAAAGALVGNVIGEGMDEVEARNRAMIEQQYGRALPVGTVTHDDVIGMSQAGVGTDLIVNHIKHNGITHIPTAEDLIRLKNSGVSDGVVHAMQTPPPPKTAAVPVHGPPIHGGPVIVEEHYYGPAYPRPHFRYHHHHHRRHHRRGPGWNVGVNFAN